MDLKFLSALFVCSIVYCSGVNTAVSRFFFNFTWTQRLVHVAVALAVVYMTRAVFAKKKQQAEAKTQEALGIRHARSHAEARQRMQDRLAQEANAAKVAKAKIVQEAQERMRSAKAAAAAAQIQTQLGCADARAQIEQSHKLLQAEQSARQAERTGKQANPFQARPRQESAAEKHARAQEAVQQRLDLLDQNTKGHKAAWEAHDQAQRDGDGSCAAAGDDGTVDGAPHVECHLHQLNTMRASAADGGGSRIDPGGGVTAPSEDGHPVSAAASGNRNKGKGACSSAAAAGLTVHTGKASNSRHGTHMEYAGLMEQEQGTMGPHGLQREGVVIHPTQAQNEAERAAKWQARAQAVLQQRIEQLGRGNAEAKAKQHLQHMYKQQQQQQQLHQNQQQQEPNEQGWQQYDHQHRWQGIEGPGRRLREEQDAEFDAALAADQGKAVQQRAQQEQQERQRQQEFVDMQKRLRASLPPEPEDVSGARAESALTEDPKKQPPTQQQQDGQREQEQHEGHDDSILQQQQHVRVCVVLPGGCKHTRRWTRSNSIDQVHDWVQSLEGFSLAPGAWQLVHGVPRKLITGTKEARTLTDVSPGEGSLVLHVERL